MPVESAVDAGLGQRRVPVVLVIAACVWIARGSPAISCSRRWGGRCARSTARRPAARSVGSTRRYKAAVHHLGGVRELRRVAVRALRRLHHTAGRELPHSIELVTNGVVAAWPRSSLGFRSRVLTAVAATAGRVSRVGRWWVFGALLSRDVLLPGGSFRRAAALRNAWLKGVSKRFGGVQALPGSDYSVTGACHSVIGHGAAKTTLFNVITGFYGPTEAPCCSMARWCPGVRPTPWHGAVSRARSRTSRCA